MLPVLEYLKKHSLQELEEEFGVTVKTKGDLAILNYSQIDSPKHPVPNSCRGLILNKNTLETVSFSFTRFFNYNEGHASEIDWDTAKIYEKLDGTLIVFYHHDGNWRVQTRGTIDGDAPINDFGFTFKDRVMHLVEEKGFFSLDDLMLGVDTNLCFIAEYTSPYNRIVTYYAEEDLKLTAVSNKKDHHDIPIESNVFHWPWGNVSSHDLPKNLDDLLESLGNLPELAEGYVVRDADGKRIKIKSPRYLAIHRSINAGNSPTEKNFARLAILGDTEEIKRYFPEYAERIEKYEKFIQKECGRHKIVWFNTKDWESQKEFALEVKDLPFSGWLFQKRNKKSDINCRSWVKENVRPEKLVDKLSPSEKGLANV